MSAITTLAGQHGWTNHAINRDGTATMCRASLRPRTFPVYGGDRVVHAVALHNVPGDPFKRSCDRNRVNCLACQRKLAKVTADAFDAASSEGSGRAVIGTGFKALDTTARTLASADARSDVGDRVADCGITADEAPSAAYLATDAAFQRLSVLEDRLTAVRSLRAPDAVSLPARSSGTHGDRYALVHGTFSMGGGFLIWDHGTESGDYLKAPDGKDWRTTSRTLVEELVKLLNRADRVGVPFILPELEASVSVNRPGPNPLAGPKRSTAGARMVTVNRPAPSDGSITWTIPEVSKRQPIRDYLVRYVLVSDVDGRGETCEHCNLTPVTCNIYATPNDPGSDGYAQSCAPCALFVVDRTLDTDPAHVVTIERLV